MAFLTEPVPPRGTALDVLPGIRRIVADNPSLMTYHGTNTYLLDSPDGLVVLDPGPNDDSHVAAILAAAAGPIARIVLTHTHRDHVGAAPALVAATGAPTAGFTRSASATFTPDLALNDGDTLAGLTALHTPGHASDHLCFARPGADGARLLFSGDHVMSWSSSIVSPPDGSMAAYFASLRLLLDRDDHLYLPGHGPPLPDPHDLVRGLLSHRVMREAAIATALAAGPATSHDLMDRLYSQVDPFLRMAAERNVIAHLEKLEAEGRAARSGDMWRAGAGQ